MKSEKNAKKDYNNMNSAYDQLRKRFYDTFHGGKPPLVFGCEIKHKLGDNTKISVYCDISTLCKKYGDFVTDGCGCCQATYTEKELEILGVPLTLADVLRMISSSPYEFEILQKEDSKIRLVCFTLMTEELNEVIDLSLPVSEWPDETLEAILDITNA